MIRASRVCSCVLPWIVAPCAIAQTFDYPSFASTTGLTLNGSAAAVSSQLRVTNNVASDVGSFWYTTPVPVREGFDTRFDFSITPSSEGMAFVIQGSPTGAATLGGSLWGVGYGFGGNTAPITNSLAIEIDAIQDTFLNDTSANEISIHTVGVLGNSENEGVSIGRVTPVADLSNNTVHTLRVRYVPGVGAPGTLEVYLDAIVAPVLSVAYSFENGGDQLTGGNWGGIGLTGTDAWVGFTSSTPFGQTGQNATVRSWNWISYHLPNACYTGNVLAGAGGPYDVLSVNNSNGGFFRTVNLVVANPFTLAVNPPPGVPQAPFVLLATVGIADATTVTPTPWGNACFPFSVVLDIGSYLAPYTLPVPAGLVFPIPLTLQGVMAPDPLNPALVQITNAVAVQFTFAPAPAILAITPNSAVVGGTISVTGSNFSPFATVDINNNPITPTTLTATTMTFGMPAGLPCGSVLRVRNPDGASATVGFNPTPLITQQVNTSGPAAGGTTYIAIGTGFAAGSTCTIGGVPATVTNASASVVTVLTPPNPPGARQVIITTPGGCSVTSTFTYL